jgi:hypothetical protein
LFDTFGEMEINRQFQDLHTNSGHVDWVMIQQVERDICLLYHQLAEYSYIMGDLDYGSVFNLPYWEFLDLDGVPLDQKEFIQNGCLVMILAMAWDLIDGSGNYISPYISTCKAALSKITFVDEISSKLIHAVRLALDIAEQDNSESDELMNLSSWVHKEFVQGYFCKMAADFANNPYYKKQALE